MSKQTVGRHLKSLPPADEALERIAAVKADEWSKSQLINLLIVVHDEQIQKRLPPIELEQYLQRALAPAGYRDAMARFGLARRELGPTASVEAVTQRAATIKLRVKPKPVADAPVAAE